MRLFYKPRLSGLKVSITPEAYQPFRPLPPPTGIAPYRLDINNIISSMPADQMTFQILGDTGGVRDSTPQQNVANAMEADFMGDNPPSFMYIVGDVVYFYGEAKEYYPQFYEPYVHYPAPIFAIPGNHDGDIPRNVGCAYSGDLGIQSLEAFMVNHCSKVPLITQDAGDIPRTAMTQPNCYWTLNTPLATFIGLYSNVPSGGVFKQDQIDWFVKELQEAPTDRALFVSVHHPPYSLDQYHSGSQIVLDLLDSSFSKSGRVADIVFSGHVHNYQRFTRDMGKGKDIPYIVLGAGGYHNLHTMQTGVQSPPFQVLPALTLENYCANKYGYMKITISKSSIDGIYYTVDKQGLIQDFDRFNLPLPY